jgi:hypothetical protein
MVSYWAGLPGVTQAGMPGAKRVWMPGATRAWRPDGFAMVTAGFWTETDGFGTVTIACRFHAALRRANP